MKLDTSGISSDFPDFRVAMVVARDLSISPRRPSELDRVIAEAEERCRGDWAGRELSQIPGIAVWRRAYRAFGIRRTSYRCSVERLVKNVLAGRRLPEINVFVDLYNMVSLKHVLPLGADDLAQVAGDVAFRYSRPGDTFLDMSGEGGEEGCPMDNPPKQGEVVYADAEKVLCRRWNWRQDARSLVTPATTAAIVTVQENGAGDLEGAVAELAALLARFAGGVVSVAVADRNCPVVEVP